MSVENGGFCPKYWRQTRAGSRRLVGYKQQDGSLSILNRPILVTNKPVEAIQQKSETVVYTSPSESSD